MEDAAGRFDAVSYESMVYPLRGARLVLDASIEAAETGTTDDGSSRMEQNTEGDTTRFDHWLRRGTGDVQWRIEIISPL